MLIASSFNADSLQSLVRAIALFATPLAEDSLFLPQADKANATGNTLSPGDIQNAAIFCLKLFTEIIILNKHRIQLVWYVAPSLPIAFSFAGRSHRNCLSSCTKSSKILSISTTFILE